MAIRTAARALFGSGVPQALIWLVLMFVAAIGAYAASSRLLTPWAHASADRSALVGYWRGEMDFGPGDTRQIVLYVRKFTTLGDILLDKGGTRGGAHTLDIKVRTKVCGPKDSALYHGSGDVANREGTRFTFGLEPDDGAQGQHPGNFEGIWNGEDRLEFTSRLNTRGPNGTTAAATATARPTSSDRTEVIRFEMRRSTEDDFNAAC